jgi:hypothetical protein
MMISPLVVESQTFPLWPFPDTLATARVEGNSAHDPVNRCDRDISPVTSGFALRPLVITTRHGVTQITDMTRSLVSPSYVSPLRRTVPAS